jgi:ribosomal protein S18 acetylase RimI-like enzyme
MIGDIVIRLYKPGDRNSLRKINCDTFDCGAPVEKFFHDREIVADLLTGYYTDFEPGSLWVAEDNNQVVGYLSGCLDSYRYKKIMRRHIIPGVFVKAIARGTFFCCQSRQMLNAWIKTLFIGGFSRNIFLNGYPAHLHINLQKNFRGKNIGSSLVKNFLWQAGESGIKGVYAAVRGDNEPARKMFTRMGFKILNSSPFVLSAGKFCRVYDKIVYGKKL